jgi:hypothetical protein
VMHAVASVDGFAADAGGDVGPLFEWYLNGEPKSWMAGRSRRLRPRSAACAGCGSALTRSTLTHLALISAAFNLVRAIG